MSVRSTTVLRGTTTSWPSDWSRSTRCEPRKPPPPVTRTRMPRRLLTPADPRPPAPLVSGGAAAATARLALHAVDRGPCAARRCGAVRVLHLAFRELRQRRGSRRVDGAGGAPRPPDDV